MKSILIYGKGKTGEAVKELCESYGFKYILVDDTDYSSKLLKGVDTVVVSPGIPFFHRIYKDCKKCNIEIIGEIEFAYRFLDRKNKIVAVTGTDGKSTTVKIIEHLLKDSYKTYLCGNYGVPFSSIVKRANEEPGIVILELSSFQIYSLKNFRPNVSAFLNFSVDHLDWHKKLKHYFLSKEKLFRLMDSNSYAVLNYDSKFIRNVRTEAKKIYFSTQEKKDIFIKDKIYINSGEERTIIENRNKNLIGKHNLKNISVAVFVALLHGLKADEIEGKIETFEPLPHRLELVKEINGVLFYNDSKSTTVQSLKVAIESFNNPIFLIVGGINKGGDFSQVSPLLEEKVKKVFLIGRDSSEINDMIKDSCETQICNNLKEAVERAYSEAERGDVVLLSPGCASFDMFKGYAHRGDSFKEIVESLDGKRVLL